MDERYQEIHDFISGKAGKVNTFLVSVRSDGRPYIRQVSAFIEGWQLGTISSAANLKVTQLRKNPYATYLFSQQQPTFGSKNVWLQGKVRIADDPSEVQAFLERRAAALGTKVPEAEFARVVIETTPEFMRVEGLLNSRTPIFFREFPS